MTEEPANLVLEYLRVFRAEMAEWREETNHKIGVLAESMVGMRKEVSDLRKDVDSLRGDVQGLRADMRMIAIAVDEHTTQLDRINHRLSLHDA